MKVIRAEDMGMCFGVKDALGVINGIRDPTQVTIHGELVHNPTVISRLSEAGFRQVSESDRGELNAGSKVLVTAHGISDKERQRLQNAGKELIDTTCPLVRRAHQAATELNAEGRHVLVIGSPGHVEVQGITEDLDSFSVVSEPDQVESYRHGAIGVLCQTTMPMEMVMEVYSRIREQNSDADIRFIDTVCHPTKRRQIAVLDLLQRVDAVVVVGGHNSNNTRRLVEVCKDNGVRAWRVSSSIELRAEWFENVRTVGLTAGTSTLDDTIQHVQEALEEMVYPNALGTAVQS